MSPCLATCEVEMEKVPVRRRQSERTPYARLTLHNNAKGMLVESGGCYYYCQRKS